MNYPWKEIIKAVSIYSSSIAEFKTIIDELDYGRKNVYDYPGLADILSSRVGRYPNQAEEIGSNPIQFRFKSEVLHACVD